MFRSGILYPFSIYNRESLNYHDVPAIQSPTMELPCSNVRNHNGAPDVIGEITILSGVV